MKTKNSDIDIKKLREEIPFVATYKDQEYIVVDIVEVKNEQTSVWEPHYLYRLVKDFTRESRYFARNMEAFNSKYIRE